MSLVALLSMLCDLQGLSILTQDSWLFMLYKLYKHTGLMFNDNDLIFCLLVWYCCFGIVWTVRQAVPVNDIKCKLRWCKPLHGSFSSGPLLLNSDQLMTKTSSAQLRWHHWCHREPTQLFWKPDQSHQTTQSNLTLANLNFSDGACLFNSV